MPRRCRPSKLLADIDRPLAERGERDALRIGERLKLQQREPDADTGEPGGARAAHGSNRRGGLRLSARRHRRRSAALSRRADDASWKSSPRRTRRSKTCSSSATTPASPSSSTSCCRTSTSTICRRPRVVALEYSAATDWAHLEGAPARVAYYDFPKNSRAPVTAARRARAACRTRITAVASAQQQTPRALVRLARRRR